MKKLQLDNLGVQEMNTAEMTKVEGGGLLSGLLTGPLGGTLASLTLTAVSVKNDTFSFLSKQIDTLLSAIWGL